MHIQEKAYTGPLAKTVTSYQLLLTNLPPLDLDVSHTSIAFQPLAVNLGNFDSVTVITKSPNDYSWSAS